MRKLATHVPALRYPTLAMTFVAVAVLASPICLFTCPMAAVFNPNASSLLLYPRTEHKFAYAMYRILVSSAGVRSASGMIFVFTGPGAQKASADESV